MKQILICCIALIGIAYAGIQEDVLSILQDQSKRQLRIVSFEPLKKSKLSLVVVEDKVNGYRSVLLAENKDNVFVLDAFFGNDKNDKDIVNKTIEEARTYNFKLQNSSKLNALFKSIPNDYAIKIQGNSDKITYIVSDPMCSHCQEELRHIDSRLKTSSVVMIPVAFLGTDSLDKAAEIQATIKEAKTPQQQIDILKKIYATTYQATKQSADNTKRVENITKQIGESGLVEAVPFIYEIN